MDYSGYTEFPFPSNLSAGEKTLKKYFLSLADGEQLKLLNGSRSYEEFRGRVERRMSAV